MATPVRWLSHALLCALCLAGAAWASDPDEDAGLAVEAQGNLLKIQAQRRDLADVANAIAQAAKVQVDGTDSIRGQDPITLHFAAIPVRNALALVADTAGRLLRQRGPAHFVIGPAGEREQLQALHQTFQRAEDSGDRALIDAAEAELLEFYRPREDGSVLPAPEAWFEAARRAERDDRLETAESYRRVGVDVLKTRDGEQGADYGLALTSLGLLSGRLGRADEDRALTEQGLRLAEAELGLVHLRLAPVQALLASRAKEAGDSATAEDLYRRAIEGFGAPDPDDFSTAPRLALALDGLALLLQGEDRWAESVPLLERSLELHRALLGEEGVGSQVWFLGLALFRSERPAEAKPWLQRATQLAGVGQAQAAELLQAIELLGPFADGSSDARDLDALAERAAAAGASSATRLAGSLLEQRAATQYLSGAHSSTWETSCAASAIVSTALDPGKPGTAMLRGRMTEDCIERVRAARHP